MLKMSLVTLALLFPLVAIADPPPQGPPPTFQPLPNAQDYLDNWRDGYTQAGRWTPPKPVPCPPKEERLRYYEQRALDADRLAARQADDAVRYRSTHLARKSGNTYRVAEMWRWVWLCLKNSVK